MTVYTYVDTLPQPINQGEVVKYFATRPQGMLLFSQSTLSVRHHPKPWKGEPMVECHWQVMGNASGGHMVCG